MSISAGRGLVFGCFGEFVSKHCGLTLLGNLQLRDSSFVPSRTQPTYHNSRNVRLYTTWDLQRLSNVN